MATGNQVRPITVLDGFALMLIGFKLAGVGEVAGWSWWWVLAPIWIYVVIVVAVKTLLRIGKRVAKKKEAKEAREALRRAFR